MPLIRSLLSKIEERSFWKILKASLLHFLFPKKCLHCSELIFIEDSLLCHPCGELLELIPPFNRCPYCFDHLEDNSSEHCPLCERDPSPFVASASSFEYEEVAAEIVKQFKYGKKSYLKEGMGAALFLQFQEMGWPLPDLIVPVPLSPLRRLSRGFNQSALLAEELSNYLKRPSKNLLKRYSGGFSQASLSLEERKKLNKNRFYLANEASFEGKKLLLIDDVMTSGFTLRRCAEVLMEGHPRALYALTFCRTTQSRQLP